MKVGEIMSTRPVYCSLSTSARTAAAVMQEKGIGILAVTKDPFTTELVGVVTDRDLCLRVIAAGRDPSYIWISECATLDPVCCTADDDIRHALELMKEHQVRRLPVVSAKQEVIGMLSLTDLVREGSMSADEIAAALQKICEAGQAARKPRARIVTAA